MNGYLSLSKEVIKHNRNAVPLENTFIHNKAGLIDVYV